MKRKTIISTKIILLTVFSVFISAFSNFDTEIKITEDVIKTDPNFENYEIDETISPTLTPKPSISPSSSSIPKLPIKTPSPIPSVDNKTNKKKTTEWIKPVEGSVPNPFGNDYYFYGSYRAGHTGIDINAKIGTPVKAVADGVVKYIKPKNNLRYGLYVVIEHNNKLFSLSGHLSKINVKLKQKVKQGDIIGFTGVSGLASFPHIHFEVIDKIPVRDGAYGYNYICKHRAFKTEPKEEQQQKLLTNKPPIYDLLPLNKVVEEFGFINHEKKEVNKFYRMKAGHCVEVKLPKITYYNPENFFLPFEKAPMPEFKLMRKTIISKRSLKVRKPNKSLSNKII